MVRELCFGWRDRAISTEVVVVFSLSEVKRLQVLLKLAIGQILYIASKNKTDAE